MYINSYYRYGLFIIKIISLPTYMNVIDVHYDLTEIKVLLFLLSFMDSNIIYCLLLGRIDTANKLVVFATIVN